MHHHFILLRHLRQPIRRHDHHIHHYSSSASSMVSSINWVRDRALDHAVEKERDLKPMTNLKNLILSQPSKTLPLNIITDNKTSLNIPSRPIDFIRKYPSVFQEYSPGAIATIHPHIKLTPETVTLHTEERLLFDTENYKQDVADRLLKLLMLGRINRIPLSVIDRLKWDLGLPDDYTESVVPGFPDYFKVTGNGELELVCWSDELAVSVMEKSKMEKFPVEYSRGFEMDSKFKKWVDDWQKVKYVSPYESEVSLEGKSEEADKWVVGLLHEVLHLLVPKKTEKDNLLFLGEYLGVRSRFKRALLEHPGIFYVSSKLRTHTVVLRECYKRDLLVSKPAHPLMNLRSSYIHLMYMVAEKSKSKKVEGDGAKKPKTRKAPDGEEGEVSDVESDFEEDDSDIEGVTDSESDEDDIERDNLVVDARAPTKQDVAVKSDDDGESEDLENGNKKIRERTGRTVKFNDSPRRNTPNARPSDNDRRRVGRKDSKYASREKSDSRTKFSPRSDSSNKFSGERTDSRNKFSGERSDARNKFSGERSDARNKFSGERSDARNKFSGERSDSRNKFSGERSDSRNKFSGERSDIRNKFSGERSDSRNKFSGERSDSRNKFSGERSDSRNKFSGERSDSRNKFSGERSDSRNKFSGERSDSRNKFGGERSDSRNKFSGERSDSRNKFSGERSDSRNKFSGERSDSRTNRDSDRRVTRETRPTRSLRTESPGARVSRDRSSERSGPSRKREGRF